MTRMPQSPTAAEARPIAQKDAAETFGEPDVTVSGTGVETSSGSIQMRDSEETAIGPDPNGNYIDNAEGGMVISPIVNISEVSATLQSSSWSTSGEIDGYKIERLSDGAIVGEKTGLGGTVSPGDTLTLTGLSLDPSHEYAVYVTDSEDKMDVSYNSQSGFDHSGEAFSTAGAWIDGTRRADITLAFKSIEVTSPPLDVSAYITWSDPDDIYRWDAATFAASPDGETVTVNIEANDGSGWTEIATDISRGDSINAHPDSAVRFRVDIKRQDIYNNPTLDSIYRRWVV